MVKTEPETMVSMCHELLEQQDVEAAIRVGDVYALMIEWFYSQRQMEQAHTLVEKMRGRGIILSPYLDSEMVLQHGQSVALAAPQLGSCASPWHLWQIWLARRGRPTGRPATASGARASRAQSRRFPRL